MMLSRLAKLLGVVLVVIAVLYVSQPITPPPPPPPSSLMSDEPADTESIYRMAYFTSLSREEVMAYYKANFPSLLRINYPPEDSYTLVRDQTPSSWLEELTSPFRNSLFINGYYPTKPTEQINRQGRHYAAKITLKYLPTTFPTRITSIALIFLVSYLLLRAYGTFFQTK